jgi:hypothetical protein
VCSSDLADITAASSAPGTPAADGPVTLTASLTIPGFTNASYPVYQDNFGFIHNRKIDMTRFLAGDANPITLTLNEAVPPVPAGSPAAPTGVNTSQMSLALGNLWITGGYPINFGSANYQAQGMAVWVHQQAPDTTAPRISYHIPQAGRTNYPRHAPLSFLIPEHPRRGGPRNGLAPSSQLPPAERFSASKRWELSARRNVRDRLKSSAFRSKLEASLLRRVSAAGSTEDEDESTSERSSSGAGSVATSPLGLPRPDLVRALRPSTSVVSMARVAFEGSCALR